MSPQLVIFVSLIAAVLAKDRQSHYYPPAWNWINDTILSALPSARLDAPLDFIWVKQCQTLQ